MVEKENGQIGNTEKSTVDRCLGIVGQLQMAMVEKGREIDRLIDAKNK